ncbi:MAG: hypothetical protein CFE21_19650 [Bacteroidetes bacterium B1(2017)]|nr:MAG: hypothetical protein CFE21_19650 [Bacteroidetes bacterium B1(2017)]
MNNMKNFTISNKGVAFENFIDEIVVVNLPIGYYYSLKGSARALFLHIVNGSNREILSKFIVSNFEVTMEDAVSAAEDFITKLDGHNLLVETMNVEDIIPNEMIERTPFDIPTIEIYDDMKELLSLDPIHDVDSVQGWPLKK